MSWLCHTCGEMHDDIPLSFATDYPDNYANLSAEARTEQAIIGSDQCVIEEDQFYVRGLLEIPIHNSDERFLWGVWASLWKGDYLAIDECWDEEGRENHHGPFKGRLGNSLKEYSPDTFNLRLTIKLQPVGQRPLFFIDEPEHPLAIAQNNGMTRDQVDQLISSLMH